MDHNELVSQLKHLHLSSETPEVQHLCFDAATTIEALLEELRGICWCCAHGKKYDKAPDWSKMTTCEHMRELGTMARSGGKCKCSHWEWRGVPSAISKIEKYSSIMRRYTSGEFGDKSLHLSEILELAGEPNLLDGLTPEDLSSIMDTTLEVPFKESLKKCVMAKAERE